MLKRTAIDFQDFHCTYRTYCLGETVVDSQDDVERAFHGTIMVSTGYPFHTRDLENLF